MATNDFETKFGILADATLSDKLPAVKKYSIGFQTLETEGDNNEKAIGVNAYKIGSRLIYVPVFWLNGRVKGGDIMYLKSEDMFLPFTEVWVNFVETGKDFTTKDVVYGKKDDSRGTPYRISTFNLGRFGSKQAGMISKLDTAGLEKMGDYYETPDISLKNHLSMFSPKAAADLAELLTRDNNLANAMFRHYAPSELTDILTPRIKAGTKVASAPQVSFITDRTAPVVKTLSLDDKKKLWRTGMVIVDNRKEASTAYKPKEDYGRWETPTDQGWYKVLMGDYTTKEGYYFKLNKNKSRHIYMGGEVYEAPPGGLKVDQTAEIENKGLPGKEVTAEALRAINKSDKDDNYYLVDGTSAYELRDVYRNNISSEDSSTALRLRVIGVEDSQNFLSGVERSLVLTGKNGKLFTKGDVLYIPTGAKLITAKRNYNEHEFFEGDIADSIIDSSWNDTGFTLVKVASDGHQFTITTKTAADERLSRNDALIKLVTKYNLREKQAAEILVDAKDPKRVVSRNGVTFFVALADDYEPSGNDMSITKEVVSASKLDDKAVQSIIQAAQEGNKEVLDTKVLSEMAKSAYPLDRVKDDIPVFVKAIDRLGRTLFMFYWHNDAFEDRYGKHSIEGIEDSLRENIRSMGDLVIYLKEKTTSVDETVATDRDPEDLSDDLV